MRSLLYLLLGFMLLQGCTNDQKIFRSVEVYKKYDDVKLGDDKSKLAPIIEDRNGRTYLLPKTFGVANEIELIFNAENRLRQIVFSYPKKWNEKAAIEDYMDMLGDPVIKNKAYQWNDGSTQFEVYSIDGVPHSRLTDLISSRTHQPTSR